jgi:hypothetical protein
LKGASFSTACLVNVTAMTSGRRQQVAPDAATLTDSFMAFTVPSAFQLDVYSVAVVCAGEVSNVRFVNVAQPYWMQGDQGDAATSDASNGGWIRVFGLNLSLEPLARISSRKALRTARRQLRSPEAADPQSVLAAAQALIAAQAAYDEIIAGAPPTTLVLTPAAGGAPIRLVAAPGNLTSYSAYFAVPSGVAPGFYNATISNGIPLPGGADAVPLVMFITYDAPRVTGITIKGAFAWPPGVFVVDRTTEPHWMPGANFSDASLATALASAQAAGGGTVFFPPGKRS